MNKKLCIVLSMAIIASLGIATAGLASMLGISSAAATKVINIINTASTVATIIALLGTVAGAGVISAGIVAAAKAMIKKYGAAYAEKLPMAHLYILRLGIQ